jgi:hypothetical protein
MEIKEAVEAGSTSEGSFLVSGFLDDAASVAKQVNYEPAEKSAESVGFAAPATEPSGSAYEPADPTVANPSTEGPSESELITMSAEIEYAELGDESYPIVPNTTGQDSSFSGHGVPQWYGAESSGSIRAYADIDYSWDSLLKPSPAKLSVLIVALPKNTVANKKKAVAVVLCLLKWNTLNLEKNFTQLFLTQKVATPLWIQDTEFLNGMARLKL